MSVNKTNPLFKNNKKCMVEDPLQFLLKLLGITYQKWYPYVRGFIIRLLLLCQFMNITSLFIVIQNYQLKQYATFIVLTQPAFCGLTTLIGFARDLPKLKASLNYCWPIDCCGKEVERKILKASKDIKFASIIMLVVCVVSHLTTALPFIGDEEEINSIIFVIQRYVPGLFRPIGLNMFYFGSFIFGYGLAYPMIFTLYELHHLQVQIELLQEHLLKISEDYEPLDDRHVDDEEYQKIIYHRLRICIKHHINIIKLSTLYQNNVKYAMLYLPFGSTSLVAACYFIKNISPKSNIRMILVLLSGMIIATSLSFSGQRLIDSNSKLFQIASECPWIYWNSKNKRALHLLLVMSMRPLGFSTYGDVKLNLQLLLLFLKWMYSLVAFLQ